MYNMYVQYIVHNALYNVHPVNWGSLLIISKKKTNKNTGIYVNWKLNLTHQIVKFKVYFIMVINNTTKVISYGGRKIAGAGLLHFPLFSFPQRRQLYPWYEARIA